MKTITIWLPDVEAAMLVEMQNVNKAHKGLRLMVLQKVRNEYRSLGK